MTEVSHFTGFLLIGHDHEVITRIRRTVQALNLNGHGRADALNLQAKFVGQRTYTAVVQASQNDVAFLQRTVLNQYGGNGATTSVKARLNDNAFSRCRRHCFQLKHFRNQLNRLQQLFNTVTGLGGNVYKLRITAPLFGNHAVLREFVTNAVKINTNLIDLVHRNDHGYFSRFGVLDRLNGLGHHAVVSSDHQDNHVGCLGTTSTHGGKRRVARGIQEGHATMAVFNVVGTDMLGDTTRFTGGHFGTANVVQQ